MTLEYVLFGGMFLVLLIGSIYETIRDGRF
jgi:hypothetical protein